MRLYSGGPISGRVFASEIGRGGGYFQEGLSYQSFLGVSVEGLIIGILQYLVPKSLFA